LTAADSGEPVAEPKNRVASNLENYNSKRKEPILGE